MLLNSIFSALLLVSSAMAADDEIVGPVIGIDLGTTYSYPPANKVASVYSKTAVSKSSQTTRVIE
jgi:hypothetical protein